MAAQHLHGQLRISVVLPDILFRLLNNSAGSIVPLPVHHLIHAAGDHRDPVRELLPPADALQHLRILAACVKHHIYIQIILLHQSDHTVGDGKHIDLILSCVDLRILHAGRKRPDHTVDLIRRPKLNGRHQLFLIPVMKLQLALADRLHIIDVDRPARTDNSPVSKRIHGRLIRMADLRQRLAAVPHARRDRNLQHPPALFTDIMEQIA